MIQVVIPMTGYGSRFKAAGYKPLKPFIKVFGKTMIEWVVSMYDKDTVDFIFIARKEHLQNDPDFNLLYTIAKSSEVIAIDNWEKLGPVNDFIRAYETGKIKKEVPTIINYCDFFCLWNYKQFIESAILKCDGAIPCYTGFHPHLIPLKNLYASCNIDENNFLKEIKEKFSFEKDKTKAHHSPGIYYFKSGEIADIYCRKLVQDKTALNGEYYASLVYNNMVKDGLTVWCPDNVKYFCQWGTPEDLQEFEMWMHILKGVK